MAKVTKVLCVFSIKYFNPNYPDEVWAVDWNWQYPRQWARSWRELMSLHWTPLSGIDQFAYEAILTKFGLLDWAKELPPEKVQFLSPAQLIAIRRTKEKDLCLPRLEVFSETLGDYRPAEDYF